MAAMLKRYRGLIIGVALLVIIALVPTPTDLGFAGKMSLGVLACGLALWVTNSIPLGISCLALTFLVPVFGILDTPTVVSSFMSTAIFFVIATFGITIAMTKTNLPMRFTGYLLRIAGKSPAKIVLCSMFAAGLLSSITSTIAAVAIVMSVDLVFLKATGMEKGKSNLGKCIMIGLPVGGTLGGCMTPAGTPINIFGMNFLSQYAGIDLTFLQWMIVGVPFGLIMIPIVCLIITRIYKPEPFTDESYEIVRQSIRDCGPLAADEIKTLVIVGTTVVLWICSTWVPALDITRVAIASLLVMFLPGIDLLTWKEYNEGMAWDVVLMLGCVSVVTAGIVQNGAADWLLNLVTPDFATMSPLLIALILALIMAGLRFCVPMGPAVTMIAYVPLMTMAATGGISPVIAMFIVVFIGVPEVLLPLDPIPLITYKQGYFKMSEMFKTGVIPTFLFAFYCALLLPLTVHLLGF